MLQVNVGMVVYPEYEVNITHSLFHSTEDFERYGMYMYVYYVCRINYNNDIFIGIMCQQSTSSPWLRLWRKRMMQL